MRRELLLLLLASCTPTSLDESRTMSNGARLFSQMNCTGCHANGGGGMGPALKDGKWLYGSSPPQVFASIMEGRPNGMPSYKARLTDDQAWQLTSFVRSLSGLAPGNAAPGRSDHMFAGDPPARTKTLTPVKAP